MLGDGSVKPIYYKKNAKIKVAKGERLTVLFEDEVGDLQYIRYTAK